LDEETNGHRVIKIRYFESLGKEHTQESLKIAKDYAEKNDIKSVLIASTTGFTAEKAVEVFKGSDVDLVIVTHVTGFLKTDHQQFPEELRKKLESQGIKFLTAAHAFSGSHKVVDCSSGKIIANTLRMFSQGVKVCIEISTMAADAGLVKSSEDVVVVAGTGKGADTVLVIRPSNSRNLFETKVKKILAMPNL
jgi:hypothetical protein